MHDACRGARPPVRRQPREITRKPPAQTTLRTDLGKSPQATLSTSPGVSPSARAGVRRKWSIANAGVTCRGSDRHAAYAHPERVAMSMQYTLMSHGEVLGHTGAAF